MLQDYGNLGAVNRQACCTTSSTRAGEPSRNSQRANLDTYLILEGHERYSFLSKLVLYV